MRSAPNRSAIRMAVGLTDCVCSRPLASARARSDQGRGEQGIVNAKSLPEELQGAGPRARGKSGKVASFVDINGDSYLDLNLHFDLEEMDVSPDDTEFTLTGMLNDGTQVEGSDAISIIQLWNAVDEVFLTGVALSDTVIPEPATLSLLILGGLAMIRRTRRS